MESSPLGSALYLALKLDLKITNSGGNQIEK